MNRFANILYRPTENHVGVIYRCSRFHRFVDPDRWAFTLPWFDTIVDETRLDMRTAIVSLTDLYTQEKVALDLDVKVFYQVDLRVVDAERRIQVLRFGSDTAWSEIIATAINDLARNVIFITKPFEDLINRDGRNFLKETLSGALAERVRGFGILLNPRFGVNIVNLQPNEEFRQALRDESAARAVGSAAAIRLGPLMEQYPDQKRDKAIYALIMQIASAVAKNGQSPDVIFPSTDEYPDGGITGGNGQGTLYPNIPGFPATPRKPRSVAGD